LVVEEWGAPLGIAVWKVFTVKTGSWTGPPRENRAPKVGMSSTAFGVRAYGPLSGHLETAAALDVDRGAWFGHGVVHLSVEG